MGPAAAPAVFVATIASLLFRVPAHKHTVELNAAFTDTLTLADLDTAGALEGANALPRCNAENDGSTRPCWMLVPWSDEPGGCMATARNPEWYGRKARGVGGRWATVVLEDNGWESQRLHNAYVATWLQERMGYQVALRRDPDPKGALRRVQQGKSHACLEYWGPYYGVTPGDPMEVCDDDEPELCAYSHLAGYNGYSSLITNIQSFPAAMSGLDLHFSDHWATYTFPEVTKHFRQSAAVESDPPCYETWCVDSDYPTRPCVANSSDCAVLLGGDPDDGVLQRLMTLMYNLDMRVVTKFGANTYDAVVASVTRGPTLTYAFFPSLLWLKAKKLDGIQEIGFPSYNSECEAAWFAGLDGRDPTAVPGVTCENGRRTKLGKIVHKPNHSTKHRYEALVRAHKAITEAMVMANSKLEELLRELDDIAGDEPRTPGDFRLAACRKILSWSDRAMDHIIPAPLDDRFTTAELLSGLSLMLPGLGVFLFALIKPPKRLVRLRLAKRKLDVFRPLIYVLAILMIYAGWVQLDLHSGWADTVKTLLLLASACVSAYCVQALFTGGLDLLSKTVEASAEDVSFFVPVLSICISCSISFGLIIIAAKILGATKQWLLGTFSGFLLVIAFSLKDFFADIINSVIFLMDHPYSLGDWVVVNGVEGCVETIGIKLTRIRGFDKKLILVPNKTLMKQNVTNIFRATGLRVNAAFTVMYGCPPNTLNEFVTSLRAEVLKLEFIEEIVTLGVEEFCAEGYSFYMGLATSHAPANAAYADEPPWAWWDAYVDAKTSVSILVGELLHEFGLELGCDKVQITSGMADSLRVRQTSENTPDPMLAQRDAAQRRIESRFSGAALSRDVATDLRHGVGLLAVSIDRLEDSPPQELVRAWLEDDMEVAGLCEGRGPLLLALCFTRCDYHPASRPASTKQLFMKVSGAVRKGGGDDTHSDLVATLATSMGGKYTLLAENRAGSTSLVVLARADAQGAACLLARSVPEQVAGLRGMCALVVRLGTRTVSLIGTAIEPMKQGELKKRKGGEEVLTEEKRVAQAEAALRAGVESATLTPRLLGGADALHAAHATVCMGSLAVTRHAANDPGSEAESRSAWDRLLKGIEAGRCLSGFKVVAASGANAAGMVLGKVLHRKGGSLAGGAAEAGAAAVLHSSRAGAVESARALSVAPGVAKALVQLSSRAPDEVRQNRKGELWVHLGDVRCEGLLAVDAKYPGGPLTTADPYLTFSSVCLASPEASKEDSRGLSKTQASYKTPIKRRTLNPLWRHAELSPMPTSYSKIAALRTHALHVTVYDSDLLGHDVLGHAVIPLTGAVPDTPFPFEEPVVLGGTPHGKISGTLQVKIGHSSVEKRRFKSAAIAVKAIADMEEAGDANGGSTGASHRI